MTDALDAYHGTKVAQGQSNLGEKNKGKPTLDPQEEYVFELAERDAKEVRGFLSKEDRDAKKEAPKQMNALLTWREIKSGVLVFQKLRIDSLYWGNQDGSMRSKVLTFLDDIGIPVAKDHIPNWGSTFILTMKMRARIIPKIKNGAVVPDEYYFKDGSFRKYQV